jgi:hypothetical protein
MKRKRTLSVSNGSSDAIRNDREFVGNITFKPKRPASIFTLTVQQVQTAFGTFVSIPRMCFKNIVPSTSLVFECTRLGKLDDMLNLIAEGRASLSDQDEHGNSLLFVSSSTARREKILTFFEKYALENPEIVKYLIQNGADIDQVFHWGTMKT